MGELPASESDVSSSTCLLTTAVVSDILDHDLEDREKSRENSRIYLSEGFLADPAAGWIPW